eukprot:284651-Rhodomonas_salina.1
MHLDQTGRKGINPSDSAGRNKTQKLETMEGRPNSTQHQTEQGLQRVGQRGALTTEKTRHGHIRCNCQPALRAHNSPPPTNPSQTTAREK